MSTPKVFISYRREDSQSASDRLHEKLEDHFGSENVFYDVDSIPIGRNFVEYLDEQVSQCDVLLAVIGKKWLEVKDEDGDSRLQDENDFVRIEITSALKRDKIIVVPVLVEGAKIPKRDALPPEMEELSLLNAAQVRSGRDFRRDVNDLIKALESMVPKLITDTVSDAKPPKLVPDKLVADTVSEEPKKELPPPVYLTPVRADEAPREKPSPWAFTPGSWLKILFLVLVVIGIFILLYIYPWLEKGFGHNTWFPMPFMFLPIGIIISLPFVVWDVYRWRQTKAPPWTSASRLVAWVVVAVVGLLAVIFLCLLIWKSSRS